MSDHMKGVSHITIEVTHGCNLHCRHCFNDSGVAPIDEMTDHQLISACEQISSAEPDTVCICGGEPLMRFNIVVRMVEILKKNVEYVSLTTNGTLITPEVASMLKNCGADATQVSIDGDRENHNWLRGSTTAYDRAMTGLTNLLKTGMEVQLSFIPTSRTLSQLPGIIESFTDMGIHSFNIQPLQEIGRGKSMSDFTLSGKDAISLKRNIDILSARHSCTIRYGNPVDYALYLMKHDKLGVLSIDNRGWLMITPYIPIYLGNINHYSLGEYYSHGLMGINSRDSIRHILQKVIEAESYGAVDDVEVFCDIIDESFDDIDNRIFSILQSNGGRSDVQ